MTLLSSKKNPITADSIETLFFLVCYLFGNRDIFLSFHFFLLNNGGFSSDDNDSFRRATRRACPISGAQPIVTSVCADGDS